MRMDTVRVAAIQAEIPRSLEAGLERTRALALEASSSGARIIVFPETWLPGYPIWLDVCRDVALWNSEQVKTVFAAHAANSVDVEGDSGAALARIAADTGTALIVGVVETVSQGRGSGTLYNSILTYGPDGELLNHHRKLVPTYTERLLWGPGDANGLHAVDANDARVGSLVCWEHWMPLARQALHDSGEHIHAALWPTVHEMHQVASRQYAFEGRCFVIASGSLMRARDLPPELEPHPDRVTDPDQWLLRGGSAIIAPDGSYLVEPVFDSHAVLLADLDLTACRRESMTLDVAGHYSRPDCFQFSVRSSSRA